MAGISENEAVADVHVRQLRATDSPRSCFNVTIYPKACGGSCNLTYHRTSNGTGLGTLVLSAAIPSVNQRTITAIYSIVGISSTARAEFQSYTFYANGTIASNPSRCQYSTCWSDYCEIISRVYMSGIQSSAIVQGSNVKSLNVFTGSLSGATTLAFGTLINGAVAYQGATAGSNGGNIPFNNRADGSLNVGICVPVTAVGK